MAAIEASLFAESLSRNIIDSQREEIKQAYEQHLISTAPSKVPDRSESDRREKYFETLDNKGAFMARNISLFTYNKEFVSGW